MNVLVIGSGGREHALVWKLAQSPLVRKILCAPGNPGIEGIAKRVPVPSSDIPALLALARKESIDLTVVGPEQPLADGIADEFERAGLRLFGPTRRAAALEWSKAFAKDFMQRHRIPTAGFRTYPPEQRHEATAYVDSCPVPVVLKTDGLAAGKGVFVCRTHEEARLALAELTNPDAFGVAGSTIVIEEFMEGEEASVFAVTDGQRSVTLAPAQDHKRVNDGDQGKNTGGMGAFAPAPRVTPVLLERVHEDIIEPTLKGMAAEGRPFKGCLYVGLMLTPDGPRVVEYNCRFGDPETQVVLPLYAGDLAVLLVAACDGTLTPTTAAPEMRGSAVCVVLASGGYPDAYQTGKEIRGVAEASAVEGSIVFHSGTRIEADGTLATAGGRVFGVTAVRHDRAFASTIASAYATVAKISFEGMHFRHDIGKKAITSGDDLS